MLCKENEQKHTTLAKIEISTHSLIAGVCFHLKRLHKGFRLFQSINIPTEIVPRDMPFEKVTPRHDIFLWKKI